MNISLELFGRSLTIGSKRVVSAASLPSKRQVGPAFGRMFRGAQTDNTTLGWAAGRSSADTEYLVSALQLRDRHRQLDRDDGLFRHIMRLFQNNVCGFEGIKLEMKCRDDSKELMLEASDEIEEAWERAMEEENCTVQRDIYGAQLQHLAIRAFKRDGAILFRKHRGFNNAFGFALQPLEIDMLDHNWNKPWEWNGNTVKFGREMDQYGATLAYWLLTRHPGEITSYASSPNYRIRVPADEIIAIWDYERAQQTLGYSDMCGVSLPLHHLSEYILSENYAARQGADQGGFFKKNPLNLPDKEWTGPKDDEGNYVEERESGAFVELPWGWEAQQLSPTHPNQAFQQFVKANQRAAANGASVSYNSAAGDFGELNYSSWKAMRLEDVEEYKRLQKFLIKKLMRPWFNDWIVYAMLSNQVKLPFEMLDRIRSGACWIPRIWKSVEPLKEAQADELEIAMGVSSRIEKIQDRGGELEDIDEDRKRAKESEKAHGLEPAPMENAKAKPTVKGADATEATPPTQTEAES